MSIFEIEQRAYDNQLPEDNECDGDCQECDFDACENRGAVNMDEED